MKVLAIGCHPDDLELNAYGTLAKYVKQGHEVYVCVVTNGNQGHFRILPEELGKMRVEEARQASVVIGAKEYFNLGVDDCLVSHYDMPLVHKLIECIRYVCPDLIITHAPDDYAMDHVETSLLVFRAAFMATLPHYCTKEGVYPEKIPSNIPIYYMAPTTKTLFVPTDYVNITEEMELKHKAMLCHKSQIEWLSEHDGADIMDTLKADAAHYGKTCGVPYAEAFHKCEHDGRVSCENLLPKNK